MKTSSFTIILSIVTFIADSAIFNSLTEIKQELLYLCIALTVISIIWLSVSKLYFKKIDPTSTPVYLFIISVVTLSSMGVNILMTPEKKDYSNMLSISVSKSEVDTLIIRYANLGFLHAQLAASATYMEGDKETGLFNPSKSLEYALLGSINGDTASLMNAAKMYFDGHGTEVNYERAYFLLSMAKKNGSKRASILMKNIIENELIDVNLLNNIDNFYNYGDSTIFQNSD